MIRMSFYPEYYNLTSGIVDETHPNASHYGKSQIINCTL